MLRNPGEEGEITQLHGAGVDHWMPQLSVAGQVSAGAKKSPSRNGPVVQVEAAEAHCRDHTLLPGQPALQVAFRGLARHRCTAQGNGSAAVSRPDRRVWCEAPP
ncbi:hypothetical protein NLS1_06300 [Nocardioides sp. LS1]|nr:hypothetical protein NLS1_06300 [Nocardioides sp. LS1]